MASDAYKRIMQYAYKATECDITPGFMALRTFGHVLINTALNRLIWAHIASRPKRNKAPKLIQPGAIFVPKSGMYLVGYRMGVCGCVKSPKVAKVGEKVGGLKVGGFESR